MPNMTTYVPEAHKFGPGQYAGANHSSPDYTTHYYIYNHTCTICNFTYPYNVPSRCTKSSCVEFSSVGEVEA